MVLAEFARLLDTSPKWVLNTMHSLSLRLRYGETLAMQLIVMNAIHDGFGTPMPRAFALAQLALRQWDGSTTPLFLRSGVHDDVALTIDMYRLICSYQMRLATLRESYAPLVRGRPKTRKVDALAVAADWGLDLSLIRDNLRKSPLERIRQLDAMHRYATGVRRVSR